MGKSLICVFSFTCIYVFVTQTLGIITFLATFKRKAALIHLLPNHFPVNLLMAVRASTNRGPQRDNCGVNNEHVKRLRATESRDRYYLRPKHNPLCREFQTPLFSFSKYHTFGVPACLFYNAIMLH